MGFSLYQFAKVFTVRDATGQPYILIGGQAVNYWAERYLASEPELKSLRPFTSQDIDFKGGVEDVRRIAGQLGLTPGYPPKVQMTALAGFVPFQIGDLKTAIEIVRRIPGISAATPAIRAEWGEKTIRVLDPISLLACKLELAATVPQDQRQDVAHLRILVPCVRAFLNELLQRIEITRLPSKEWLEVAHQVLLLAKLNSAVWPNPSRIMNFQTDS